MSNHPLFNYAEHTANELRRMLELQTRLDPSSMEYTQLMRNMEVLAGSLEMYNDIADFFELADKGIQRIEIIPGGKPADEPYVEEPTQFEGDPAPVSSEEPDSPADEQPEETDKPEEPAKTYEMSEVRAALVAARRRGVNVTKLLNEYGVDNFGAFPAGKYAELMDRLEG